MNKMYMRREWMFPRSSSRACDGRKLWTERGLALCGPLYLPYPCGTHHLLWILAVIIAGIWKRPTSLNYVHLLGFLEDGVLWHKKEKRNCIVYLD